MTAQMSWSFITTKGGRGELRDHLLLIPLSDFFGKIIPGYRQVQ